jgi:TolB-like protein
VSGKAARAAIPKHDRTEDRPGAGCRYKACREPAVNCGTAVREHERRQSGDKDDEYFSDGLAEEILNLLVRIPGLKVTARTSSFAFRGKEQDITEIARKLHVRTILEGSVRRAGNRIRVTAQLINGADGYHIWSERYDREMADVFDVQDEIAAAIAQALQMKLGPQAATPRYKPDLPAYEAFLKGRHLMWQTSPGGFAQGRAYLEQAISLDPHYAEAYAELAYGFNLLAAWGTQPVHEAMPVARAMATRARDLDPSASRAHAELAVVAAILPRLEIGGGASAACRGRRRRRSGMAPSLCLLDHGPAGPFRGSDSGKRDFARTGPAQPVVSIYSCFDPRVCRALRTRRH